MTVRAGSFFGSCGGRNVGCLVVVLVVKLFPLCSSGVLGESWPLVLIVNVVGIPICNQHF